MRLMFNRAVAAEHLRWAYGNNTGYLCLGLLNRATGKMTHRFYRWPTQRGRAMADIEIMVDRAGDRRIEVFYCPLLRSRPERSVDNTPPNVRVVWTDIDKPITDDVKQQLTSWGARLISSGTPGNYHVYFKFNRELTAGEHRGINIALRKMLGGDPKLVSSNALLRIPGTVNHKHTPPRAVAVEYPSTRTVGVDRIIGELTDATGHSVNVTAEQIHGDGGAWKRVDVRQFLRKGAIRTIVRMDTDEAVGRWGSRHGAVNAVVGDLIDAGLEDNAIHTLMDDFGPALSKANDERGYDVHTDVSRIIAKRMHAGDRAGDDSEQRDGLFESVPETGLSADAWKMVIRKRAEREANQFISAEWFNPPPGTITEDAGTALARPPRSVAYLIDRIAGERHNVIVTAQYKTGKTTLMVSNLIRSLTDGTRFLDEFDVHVPGGSGGGRSGGSSGALVGHWNIEMNDGELIDNYVRPAEFKQPQNLFIAHMRGYNVNLLSDKGKEWTIEWLSSRGIKVWTIDSWARLVRMAGLNENDNGEMLALGEAINEVKREAEVNACFIITHTGRAIMEEGAERTRGATTVDDWCDARWIMTRDGSITYLAVDGRDVALKTTRVDFDPVSRRYIFGSGGRAENKFASVIEYIQELVSGAPGKLNTRAIIKEAQRTGPVGARNRDKIMDALKEGVECGFFESRPGTRVNEKLWWPGGMDDGNGGPSAKVLDMSNVGRRARRK